MSGSSGILLFGDIHQPSGTPGTPRFAPEILDLISSSALCCANFEAPIDAEDLPDAPKAGPAIRQSPDLAPALRSAGFTTLCLANNHVGDLGPQGLRRTVASLGELGFDCLGCGENRQEAIRPLVVEIEGRKVAMFACAEAEFGVLRPPADRRFGAAWMLDPLLTAAIAEAVRSHDMVLVQCHAGVEEETLPLPELRDLYRSWIRMGVRFVVGHHPHIVQGSERFATGEIHYSLGNAWFPHAQAPTEGGSWNRGMLLQIVPEGGDWTSTLHPIRRAGEAVELDESGEGFAHWQAASKALEVSYEEAVDAMVERLWHERYRGYFERCFAPPPGSRRFKSRLRAVLDPGASPSGSLSDPWMLLHNIRIESHRWVAERALTRLHESSLESPAR
ncbi:MAG: CapA family protein [Fibrobacteria bacterium]|nr:CapA family protein [Fibrobacteria bacterium]